MQWKSSFKQDFLHIFIYEGLVHARFSPNQPTQFKACRRVDTHGDSIKEKKGLPLHILRLFSFHLFAEKDIVYYFTSDFEKKKCGPKRAKSGDRIITSSFQFRNMRSILKGIDFCNKHVSVIKAPIIH